MNEIQPEEARSLVDKLGPRLGYDFTSPPVFPETRKDVCAVRRMAEDGRTFGFDTIFLVWRPAEDGELKCKEIANSRDTKTKDYIYVDEVLENERDIVVRYSSAGGYSGSGPWKEEYKESKKRLGLE